MDFHCHLDLYPQPREVYAEVLRRGCFTWLVTTSPRAYVATSRVLKQSDQVLISPGLHPEVADKKQTELPQLLEQIEGTPLVGEVGLDGSARYRTHFELQETIFCAVVAKCQELGGRTLSIHSRAAAKKVLDTLERFPGFGDAVLHWFTDSPVLLRRAISMGCWFSIGPAMLLSANGRRLAELMPRDRTVPESDGPFAKLDGKPVMPWQAAEICTELAVVWRMPASEVSALLEQNSKRLIARFRPTV